MAWRFLSSLAARQSPSLHDEATKSRAGVLPPLRTCRKTSAAVEAPSPQAVMVGEGLPSTDFASSGLQAMVGRPAPTMSASREDALSARCKSVPGMVAVPEIEGNCVAVRRGGEQPEVNRQSVG